MIEEKTIKIITKGLTETFKELETYEELAKFQEEYLYLKDLNLQFYLETKRGGFEVVDFFQTINPKRVEYITVDGGEGCSLVKNLHRNIKVVFSHYVIILE